MTVDRIWCILGKKLNGEASNEELEELTLLLAQHPELYFPIQNITDLWKLGKRDDQQQQAFEALQNHLMRLADKEGEISAVNEPVATQRNQFLPQKKYIVSTVAATFLVVLCCYFYFFNAKATPQLASTQKASYKINEVSTKTGSHSKVILPDSTIVWLNGGSKLTYDKSFNQEIREVSLIGEAYFDVAKNARKPFIIHTRQMDIKVLGTVFNVKSYPEDKSSETSLIHGSIEVTMKQGSGEKIILKPKDKLTVTGSASNVSSPEKQNIPIAISKIGSINYLPADSTIIETSWVDNKLIFRDKPFLELSAELERKYGVQFIFQDEEAKALMFNGNFKNENISQALKALQLANNFSYEIINDSILIAN